MECLPHQIQQLDRCQGPLRLKRLASRLSSLHSKDVSATPAEDSTEAQIEEIVFLCQVIVLYTVILISIYNLTTGHENSHLWTALLISSLGFLLPNPTLKRNGD